jgi:hypothetical protein
VPDAPPKLRIDWDASAASAVATVSAAVVGSLFGWAGTLGGLALGSAVSTTLATVYKHGIQKSKDKARKLREARRRGMTDAQFERLYRSKQRSKWDIPWKRIVIGMGVVSVLSVGTLAMIAGARAAAGTPVSNVIRGPLAPAPKPHVPVSRSIPSASPTSSPSPSSTSSSPSPSTLSSSPSPVLSSSGPPTPSPSPSPVFSSSSTPTPSSSLPPSTSSPTPPSTPRSTAGTAGTTGATP